MLEATGPVLVPAFLPESVRSTRRKNKQEQLRNEVPAEPIHPRPAATTSSLLPAEFPHDTDRWSKFVALRIQSGSHVVYEEALQDMERHVIPLLLQHTDGNQLQAARLLGVSRATLRTKCRQYGITVDKVVDSGQ